MKIRQDVIAVKLTNRGWGPDLLEVKLADGTVIFMKNTGTNRAAFFVGRDVSVEVTPL